jgi:hypothetical protein
MSRVVAVGAPWLDCVSVVYLPGMVKRGRYLGTAKLREENLLKEVIGKEVVENISARIPLRAIIRHGFGCHLFFCKASARGWTWLCVNGRRKSVQKVKKLDSFLECQKKLQINFQFTFTFSYALNGSEDLKPEGRDSINLVHPSKKNLRVPINPNILDFSINDYTQSRQFSILVRIIRSPSLFITMSTETLLLETPEDRPVFPNTSDWQWICHYVRFRLPIFPPHFLSFKPTTLPNH